MSTPRILGLPFRSGVDQQIKVRQKRLGQLQKSPDDLVVFNSATSFVRLSSAVSVEGTERLALLRNNLGLSEGQIKDYNLAKNLVLWGGVNVQNLPGGIGYTLDNTYGFLSDDGQGLKPLPGITGMTTSYKNNGSLREATIQLKCFTRKQFEAIEAVYLRLGYTMVLEWGHTDYFLNDEQRGSTTSYSMLDKLFVNPGNLDPDQIQLKLDENKQSTSYNYDGLLARVANFNWVLNSDLSYDITLYLISWGDIIDSLKANISSNNDQIQSNIIIDTENISPNLLNIVNNRSLSDLNFLFFEIYRELTNSGIEAGTFSADTITQIQNLNDQLKASEEIKIHKQKIIEILDIYENFVSDFERQNALTLNKNSNLTSIERFRGTLNTLKSEVSSLNTLSSYDLWAGNTPGDDTRDLGTGRTYISVIQSKISRLYKSPVEQTPVVVGGQVGFIPNPLKNNEFEDYMESNSLITKYDFSDFYPFNFIKL